MNLESSASPHSEQAEQAEDGCIDVPVLEGDWNPASNVSTGHSAVPSDAAIDMAQRCDLWCKLTQCSACALRCSFARTTFSEHRFLLLRNRLLEISLWVGCAILMFVLKVGHIPEEALSDGYAVNGVAREVIVSAAAQEVPTQRTAPSSHIEFGRCQFSHAVQLVARDTFAEHATVPYASSLPKDLVEQPRSDADGGAEVQAIPQTDH